MMKELITAFPQNILDALEIAKQSAFKQPKNPIHNILITGMGGSGIGGKIVAQWLQDDLKVPVTLLNDYTIPAFVDQHTLVIGSSYSGNTEETLTSIHEAHEKGAHIIAVCSGGEIEAFCKANHYDSVIVPGGNPPRSALAYSVIQLVNIFTQLGFVGSQFMDQIKASYELITGEENTIQQKAKEIAQVFLGKVGVIYAAAKYEGIAVRTRQQLNENAKYLCWHHVIPEMNHNELVGWGGGDERFAVLFLQTGDLIPRNQRRYEITKTRIEGKTPHVYELVAKGNSRIERSFYIINIVDWASFYLSELEHVDAMEIEIIDYLKAELATFK